MLKQLRRLWLQRFELFTELENLIRSDTEFLAGCVGFFMLQIFCYILSLAAANQSKAFESFDPAIDLLLEVICRFFFSLIFFILLFIIESELAPWQSYLLMCLFINQVFVMGSTQLMPLKTFFLLYLICGNLWNNIYAAWVDANFTSTTVREEQVYGEEATDLPSNLGKVGVKKNKIKAYVKSSLFSVGLMVFLLWN